MAPALQSGGFPAHFLVDQGRSGVQNIRSAWGNWYIFIFSVFTPTLKS